MTVSYQYDVASSASGGFTRLLFKWKGSLYKLVYRELALFIFCYGLMSVIYRYVFTVDQKRSFEHIALYCDTFMNYIPLSFILGFYVSFVASRWWQQYMAIPWPDKLLHSIAVHVIGYDEKGRIIRRTMVRYLNLSLVLVLRSISSSVKRRFPTIEHIMEAGFMTTTELEIFKTIPSTDFNTYWVPFTWFTALLRDARAQKRITDDHGTKLIMEMFLDFRSKCGLLWCYDWVSIPLVYTQVVTIATYAFFLACIIGRQYVEKSPIPYKVKPDLYIPYFTLLQFFFYMGLLKVAEQLINPFGDDDEDFELNWIIDRHMKVSYMIVDTLMLKVPPITKDIYFDQDCPVLPYTEAAVPFRKKAYRGSVANMTVPEDQQGLILPDIEEEDDQDDSKAKVAGGILSSHTGMLKPGDFVGEVSNAPGFVAASKIPEHCLPRTSEDRSSPVLTRLTGRRGSNRLGVSAGTKGGIGSAVVAIGANQVLLAAGAETFITTKHNEKRDYVVIPMESVFPDGKDIFQIDNTRASQLGNKSAFSFPASLKSRLAIRKKPVMKWKPFTRPIGKNVTSGDSPEDPLNDGCYEEECAFMWRTIEDDAVSYKHLPENIEILKESHLIASDVDQTISADHPSFSQYTKTKSRLLNKPTHSLSDPIIYKSKLPSMSCRRYSSRRSNYKPRAGAWSEAAMHHSLPTLSCPSCGLSTQDPYVIRSFSENSVFVEALELEAQNKYVSNSRAKDRRKNCTSRSRNYKNYQL